MSGPLRTRDGTPVTVERLDERRIMVLTQAPSPPGSQFEVFSDAGSFSIKVHGCKKLDDTLVFRIEGRPVNLTRQVREALQRGLA